MGSFGKQLYFGNDARLRMLEGAQALEKAVIVTLGPKGKNVLIDKNNGSPTITKDGVSVAKAIFFGDPCKQQGATIGKDASSRTNSEAGDGTTTACLLSVECMTEGNKLISLGLDPTDFKKGMEKARDLVLKNLDTYKKTISTSEEILQVATISANNDTSLGEVVQEAFTGIGEGGVVSIMDSLSRSGKTYVKFSTGLTLKTGYTSSFFATKGNTCELRNAQILLSSLPITSIEDIMLPIRYAQATKTPIVFIAPSIEQSVESSIISSVKSHQLQACCIKVPGFNADQQDSYLEDLSVLLSAKVVGKTVDTFKSLNLNTDLGKAEAVIAKETSTCFEGANTDETAMAEHYKRLQGKVNSFKEEDIDEGEGLTEQEIGNIKERIARLTGGIATIFVGGQNKMELLEKKDRFEDAVNAVRAALSEGIVPGGGTALLRASRDASLQKPDNLNNAESQGFDLVLKVCKEPCIRIINSTGKNGILLADKLLERNDLYSGFNAKAEVISDDLVENGIIDPIKVTKKALIYAIAASTMFLTTDCIITEDVGNTRSYRNDPLKDEDIFSQED